MIPDDRDPRRSRHALAATPSIDQCVDSLLDDEGTVDPHARLSDPQRASLRARIDSSPAAVEDLESLRNTVASLRAARHTYPDLTPRITATLAGHFEASDPFVRSKTSGWLLPTLIAASITLLAATSLYVTLPTPGTRPSDQVPPLAVDPSAALAPENRLATRPVKRARTDGTPLELGPTAAHDLARRWDTDLPGHAGSIPVIPRNAEMAAAVPDTSQVRVPTLLRDGSPRPIPDPGFGQLVSVRLGPAWSLWWIGGEPPPLPTRPSPR